MVARRPAVVAPELQLAPFFRARRRKTSLCSGALERSCVSLSCDLAVSSELKVSPITRKSGPQPNVKPMLDILKSTLDFRKSRLVF